MNELLNYYVVATRHPEVSGFEHLEMLLVRDELAQNADHLSPKQEALLAAADQLLLSQVAAFQTAISHITDLTAERQQRKPPADHWWWYLDVLAQVPAPTQSVTDLIPA